MLPKVKHKIQFREMGQRYTHSITIQFNEEGFVDIVMKCSETVEENFSEMVRGISPSFSLTNLAHTTEIEKWLQASKNLLGSCISKIF